MTTRRLDPDEGRGRPCAGHWYCAYVPRYAVTENGRTRYLCEDHLQEALIWRAGIEALR